MDCHELIDEKFKLEVENTRLKEINGGMYESLLLIRQTLIGMGIDTLALQLLYKTANNAITKAGGGE